MNLTELIVCADQGGNDDGAKLKHGFLKVDISGIDGNILLGSLVSSVGQDCGGVSNSMTPREISMLPREVVSKVERQKSQSSDRDNSNLPLVYSQREIMKDTDNGELAVCSSTVRIAPCEHVNTHSDTNVISRALKIKPLVQIPRVEVKRKCNGKFSSKVWYPCFSGANSPFKRTHCSVIRKKDNPSIDVCYKA